MVWWTARSSCCLACFTTAMQPARSTPTADCRQAPPHRNIFCHRLSRHDRPAHLGGFIGEFLILLGTFTGVSKGWAIAATLGVILGAAYMLWLIQRLFFGPESTLATSKPPEDYRAGQLAILAPLAALMLVMGVAPMLLAANYRNWRASSACCMCRPLQLRLKGRASE